jgi:sarcinarray family protein
MSNHRKTMKKCTQHFITIFIFLILFIFIPLSSAYENDTTTVFLYFSWIHEDNSWNDWINVSTNEYSDLNLTVGQSVKCKIQIKSKVNGTLRFCISEPGDKTYDVIEGNKQDQFIDYLIVNQTNPFNSNNQNVYFRNESIEYQWVLLTNDAWMGARAPLNFIWEITPDPTEKDDQGNWTQPETVSEEHTIAYPYLSITNWTGEQYQPNTTIETHRNSSGDSPFQRISPTEFELILLPLVLCIFILWYRHRRNKKRKTK